MEDRIPLFALFCDLRDLLDVDDVEVGLTGGQRFERERLEKIQKQLNLLSRAILTIRKMM